MKKKASIGGALGVLFFSSLGAGCGDAGEESGALTTSMEQGAIVVPQFHLDGLGAIPSSMYVTNLDFTVTEIRLLRLEGEDNQVALSVIQPAYVHFDATESYERTQLDAIELPGTGRYSVSIRIEPASTEADGSPTSLRMSGFVRQTRDGGAGLLADETVADGPIPLPFYDPEDSDRSREGGLSEAEGALVGWTPFYYRSERSAFLALGEVMVEPGSQALDFTFDLSDWIPELVEPVTEAVAEPGAPISQYSGIDVSRYIDNSGQGTEGFAEVARVRASPTLPPIGL